jgi:WW domain-containing oxidoreductase
MVTSGFFRGESFDPDKDIPNLEGKVYLVTGASTGIGYGITAHLLQHNAAKIIALSNDRQHADAMLDDLKQYGDVSCVQWQQCNLRNLKATDAVAKQLKVDLPRLDGLMLNAGVGVNTYATTEDNLDSHFQVNMLSQLHLALVLLPNLVSTAKQTGLPSRIVMMSSEMHKIVPSSCAFTDTNEINTDIGGTALYGRSKLAQVLIVRHMAKLLDSGDLGFANASNGHNLVIVNATHPGGVNTPQQDQFHNAYGRTAGEVIKKMVRPLMTDPVKHGCRSALFVLTSSEVIQGEGAPLQGQYVMPDKKVSEVSKKGQDEEMAAHLYKLSLGLLKEKIGTLEYDTQV